MVSCPTRNTRDTNYVIRRCSNGSNTMTAMIIPPQHFKCIIRKIISVAIIHKAVVVVVLFVTRSNVVGRHICIAIFAGIRPYVHYRSNDEQRGQQDRRKVRQTIKKCCERSTKSWLSISCRIIPLSDPFVS